MKIRRQNCIINGGFIIDGEEDFTICKQRDTYIELDEGIENFTICNFNMAMLGRESKLKTLWYAIKFIYSGKGR